jgi:hypothetical protein
MNDLHNNLSDCNEIMESPYFLLYVTMLSQLHMLYDVEWDK